MPLIHKLITNPELYLLTLTQVPRRQYSSALIIPRPGTRQPGTTPVVNSPWKLFKLANPKPLTVPYISIPAETSTQALSSSSPCSCFLILTTSRLRCMHPKYWPVNFWPVQIINFCFPETSLSLLLWLHLSDHHKTENTNSKPINRF